MNFLISQFLLISGFSLKPHKTQENYIGKLRELYVYKNNKKEKIYQFKKVPLGFYEFYKIAGYQNIIPEPGEYLIIVHSTFVPYIDKLIKWKELCGFKVIVETVSGSESAIDIKNIIKNHYFNDDPKPEYVLLIGDVNHIPTFYGYPWTISDNRYTEIEGNDFIPDVFIGRLSVSFPSELLTIIKKIIEYEKYPEANDTLWYKRALMIGARYPANVWTPKKVKRWIRNYLLNNANFTEVDTVFFPPVYDGENLINSSLNNGVYFVNYRGGDAESKRWIYPLYEYTDIDLLSNGKKMPIVTSFVCLTGSFDDNYPMCLGEKFIRAGDTFNLKGAIAFIGSGSGGTHTRGNNLLDEFFYRGYNEFNFPSLASLLLYSKLNLISHFPDEQDPDSGVGFYFETYNILGDPSLILYKGVPRQINVNSPDYLYSGTSSLLINITRNNNPVKGAWVSLFKENEVRDFSLTDSVGNVYFNFKPLSPGTLFVTIRGKDIYPFVKKIPVINGNISLGIKNYIFLDSIGHNDNILTPDEIVKLKVIYKNYGTQTLNNLNFKLKADGNFINLIDSTHFIGTLNPSDTGICYFKFYISKSCSTYQKINFQIDLNSNNLNRTDFIDTSIFAPKIVIDSFYTPDEDGLPDRGQTETLIIKIKNKGNFDANNLVVTFKSMSSEINVIDSISIFGNLKMDSTKENTGDPFVIKLSSNVFPGQTLPVKIKYKTQREGEGEILFRLKVGKFKNVSITGPDLYGYYVIENSDSVLSNRPDFSWVEIDPAYGGNGTPLNIKNDTNITVNLPFNFKFYGIDFTKISISDNGYVVFGTSSVSEPYNWPIPSLSLPDGFISAFWDDFDPEITDSSRDVFIKYDSNNHLFIIEWSRVQHIHNYVNHTPGELSTFEIILYDPSYYVIPTGDGEIKIQYLEITDDDTWHNFSTIGIESPDGFDGVNVLFNNIENSGFSGIGNQKAILITTQEPVVYINENFTQNNKFLIRIPAILNRNTEIKVLDKGSFNIEIFDISGRKIFKNSFKSDNNTRLKGNFLFKSSGIHFLIFKKKNFKIKKKIIYIR